MFGTKTTRAVSLSNDDGNLLTDDDLPQFVHSAVAALAQALATHYDFENTEVSVTLSFSLSDDDEVDDLCLISNEE